VTAFLQRFGAWLLVGGATLAALAFPTTGAGGLAMLIVVGAFGVGVVAYGPRVRAWIAPRGLGTGVAGALAVAFIVIGAAVVFGRVFHDPVGWTMGDWGVQHAVLADVIDGMRDGHIPRWTHALSTGDAPLETYPALTYMFAGIGALATGMADALPRFLLVFGVVVHVLVAVGITRMCLRVAPPWVACALGLTQLVDAGNISAGGITGNLQFALVHNALGQAFFLLALASLCNALERPRLRTSVSIWIFTALAAATHPSALLTGGAVVLALVVVALVATDVPARRPLVAAGHLAIGLALAAVVWMPLGERLVLYGQHFPSPPHGTAEMFDGFLQWPVPATSFAPIMYLGLVGLVAGLASRRALPALFGATGILLVLGLYAGVYLTFDLGGQSLARLGAERFHALCRPFVVAGAAYAIAVALRLVARRWRGAPLGAKKLAAAAIAVACGFTLRGCIPYAGNRVTSAVASTLRPADDRGQAALQAWAAAAAAANRPDAYGRVLFDLGDVHYGFHLTAETGLPSFHMGAIPNLLLRERIEDTSPESLRRFDVRWVVIADDSESTPRTDGAELISWENPDANSTAATLALGDPATEQKFGRYVVREVPGWDGKLARVERGPESAVATVTALGKEHVEVEVTGTDQPVLVALGLGFYPRWRAHAADGRALPVYALPSIEGGELRVLAAWVRPGKTVFTCDGALPSDGKGRGIAGLAAAAAIAILVMWSRRRWRVRALRRMARVLAWIRARRRVLAGGAAAIVALALPLAGAMKACGTTRELEVGLGLRGVATVSARRNADAGWEECGYTRLSGQYECAGVAVVSDVVAGVLNDAQPAWNFPTPAIELASLSGGSVDVRVVLDASFDGTYWVGARGGPVSLGLDSEPPVEVRRQRELSLAGRGRTSVHLEATVDPSGTRLAFVRKDVVEPERPFLVTPPDAPPPAVTAAR
jgi:hypothetical protein